MKTDSLPPSGQIIDLQDAVVYGPIASRRLGTSLGINLLPVSYKLCSFNCVYCQYGWTTNKNPKGEKLLRADALLAKAGDQMRAFQKQGMRVDCITLAGNGEPTLHPDLREIIEGLTRLRDELFPKAKLGILSDSHCVHKPEIREALSLLDERCMKLDAGTPGMLEALNKPVAKVDWDAMLKGLRQLPGVTVQSMFVQGPVDNTTAPAVEAWIQAVAFVRPIQVQVYPISRGPADARVRKVPRRTLSAIAKRLTEQTGIPASPYD